MIGEVKSVVSAGVYVVVDEVGRTSRATSEDRYKVGDRVIVIGCSILGFSGRRPAATIYKV